MFERQFGRHCRSIVLHKFDNLKVAVITSWHCVQRDCVQASTKSWFPFFQLYVADMKEAVITRLGQIRQWPVHIAIRVGQDDQSTSSTVQLWAYLQLFAKIDRKKKKCACSFCKLTNSRPLPNRQIFKAALTMQERQRSSRSLTERISVVSVPL